MHDVEKRAWLENFVSLPGPASKRLAERLIRRAVKHEVLDGLEDNYLEGEEPAILFKEVPIDTNQNIIHERDALLNKVASFNEKYNV